MYVLGVDGGTTKTIAMVADDQCRIVAAARGGGSNWAGEVVDVPMGVVVGTVQKALERAGLRGEDISMGVFTLAGADWPEDHVRRETFLSRSGISRQVKVKNDSFGGLRAGSRRPYGMVLAAGTGMNAAVITPDGVEWAFGYYETYGGAGTLVGEAFNAVLRAEDGRGQPTIMTSMMLDKLGFPTVEAMLRAFVLQRLHHRELLIFCPSIFEAALMGDAVAAKLLVHHGQGLAEYATAMTRRFHMEALEFDVVLAGSVFKGVGPLLIDTITQEVHCVAPRAHLVRTQLEPVAGSVLLAFDALGEPVTESMYQNLAESMPGAELFDTTDGLGFNPVYQDEEE